VFTGNRLRFVTAHLARCQAPSLAQPVHPADRRTDADPKLLGRLVAREPPLSTAATTRFRNAKG
jgi:hypothetical protein